MSCIRAPQSLSDAQAILACYGGANWRDLALLGLGTLVVVVLAVTVLLLTLRQVSGR